MNVSNNLWQNTLYLLTPWNRVLLEKLTGLQLVKKFPPFHGTRSFIIALTSGRHLSLSWASPKQSIRPKHTSWWSILILSSHLHLGLPSSLFPSCFPTKPLYTPVPHICYMPCSSHSSQFYPLNNCEWGIQITKYLIMYVSPIPLYLVTLGPKYSPQHPVLKQPQAYIPPSISATKFHTHTKQQAKLEFYIF